MGCVLPVEAVPSILDPVVFENRGRSNPVQRNAKC